MVSDISLRLQKWCVEELDLISSSHSGSRIPTADNLEKICRGKNREVWSYVINHVHSRSTILEMKRRINFDKLLKSCGQKQDDKELLIIERGRLKRMLTAVESKKSHLENIVLELESNVHLCETKFREINELMDEARDIRSVIEMHQHYCEKLSLSTKMYCNAISNKMPIRKEMKVRAMDNILNNPQSSLMQDMLDESPFLLETPRKIRFFTEADNFCSHNSVKKLIVAIKDKLKEHSDARPLLSHHESGIRRSVEEMVAKHEAYEIMQNILKIAKDSSKTDSSFNSENAHANKVNYDVSTLSASENSVCLDELKRQRLCHIKVFFRAQNLLNNIRKLLKEKESCFQSFFEHMKMQNAMKEEIELIKSLIELEAEIEGVSNSMSSMRAYDQELKRQTKAFQERNEDFIFKCKELNDIQMQTNKNVDVMNKLVIQNREKIMLVAKKHNNLQLLSSSLIQPFKFEIESLCSQINQNLILDIRTFEDFTRKFRCMQHFEEHCLNKSNVTKEIGSILGLLPYHNSDVVLQKCISMKRNIAIQSAILLVMNHMFVQYESNKQFLSASNCKNYCEENKKLQNAALQCLSCIVLKGSESAEKAEQNCSNAQGVMIDWWDQPAQFIPEILAESRTLEEWLNLLTVM